jgi:hypothetical protein
VNRIIKKGTETIAAEDENKIINFGAVFTTPPIVNVSSNQNTNVYVSNVTNVNFTVNKLCDVEVEIQYVVIES